ncbi:hypothetical protein AB0L35_10880 [Streptomyces sp. NPDC052309]|uniref:hypothetical protein n=1 Tax=Streptomyces sp. NPDC052309 TaxID=3155421 RepID=UPI00343CBF10
MPSSGVNSTPASSADDAWRQRSDRPDDEPGEAPARWLRVAGSGNACVDEHVNAYLCTRLTAVPAREMAVGMGGQQDSSCFTE